MIKQNSSCQWLSHDFSVNPEGTRLRDRVRQRGINCVIDAAAQRWAAAPGRVGQ
jgi:hypothetical protein